jgi:hypothetical protein
VGTRGTYKMMVPRGSFELLYFIFVCEVTANWASGTLEQQYMPIC